MKKLFLAVAATALGMLLLPQISFAACTDHVPADLKEATDELVKNNILRGNDNGKCELDKHAIRIELVTMMLRVNYKDSDIDSLAAKEPGTFPDLPSNAWYFKTAKAAKFLHVIEGDDKTGNGRFTDKVKAGEAFLMALRYSGVTVPNPKAGEAWYDPAINVAKEAGLKTYPHTHEMTRGDISRLIYEYVTRYSSVQSAAANYNSTPAVTNNTTPNQPSTPPANKQTSGSFNVVGPLRYLAENFDALSPQQTLAIYSKLNDTDLLQLQVYTAFGYLVHYKACQADTNVLFNDGQKMVSCAQNAAQLQQTAQFYGGDIKQATSHGYSQRNELLIAQKCGTGEISAGTCNMYTGIQNQNMNRMNEIFRNMISECNYVGEVLSNGGVCVAN